MKVREIINEAVLDPEGWGNTPHGTDIDYFGLRVQMKPSTFLKLSLPLEASTTNTEVEKHMRAGGKIAFPMLDIEIPEKEWKVGDFSKPAKVVDHEGRNRMTAWIKIHGDDPIQVNIKPRYLRRRNLSDEMILALSQGMIGQRGNYIEKPFDPNTAI